MMARGSDCATPVVPYGRHAERWVNMDSKSVKGGTLSVNAASEQSLKALRRDFRQEQCPPVEKIEVNGHKYVLESCMTRALQHWQYIDSVDSSVQWTPRGSPHRRPAIDQTARPEVPLPTKATAPPEDLTFPFNQTGVQPPTSDTPQVQPLTPLSATTEIAEPLENDRAALKRSFTIESSDEEVDESSRSRHNGVVTTASYSYFANDRRGFCQHVMSRCEELTMKATKKIVTEWMNFAEPKRKKLYGKYDPTGDGPLPPWWPLGVPWKEPAHLSKKDLVLVAVALLELHRHPDVEGKPRIDWVRTLKREADRLIDRMCDDTFGSSRNLVYNRDRKNRALNEVLPDLFSAAQMYEDHCAMWGDQADSVPGTQFTWKPATQISKTKYPSKRRRKQQESVQEPGKTRHHSQEDEQDKATVVRSQKSAQGPPIIVSSSMNDISRSEDVGYGTAPHLLPSLQSQSGTSVNLTTLGPEAATNRQEVAREAPPPGILGPSQPSPFHPPHQYSYMPAEPMQPSTHGMPVTFSMDSTHTSTAIQASNAHAPPDMTTMTHPQYAFQYPPQSYYPNSQPAFPGPQWHASYNTPVQYSSAESYHIAPPQEVPRGVFGMAPDPPWM